MAWEPRASLPLFLLDYCPTRLAGYLTGGSRYQPSVPPGHAGHPGGLREGTDRQP
jgi:hypothetical protein